MMDAKASILLGPCHLFQRSLELLLSMTMKEQQEDRGLLVFIASGCFIVFDFIMLYVFSFMYILYRRDREFKVVIKLAARADLHHLGLFLQGRQTDAPQEALQVLDIVLRELPTTRFLIQFFLLLFITIFFSVLQLIC